jgi:hypothetical protein
MCIAFTGMRTMQNSEGQGVEGIGFPESWVTINRVVDALINFRMFHLLAVSNCRSQCSKAWSARLPISPQTLLIIRIVGRRDDSLDG